MKGAMIWPAVALLLVGCGAAVEDDPTDAEAESAPSLDGKADSAGIYGNYQLGEILTGSDATADGDLISLSLFRRFDHARPSPPRGSAGAYARVRAYNGGAELVTQTDTFRLFTSGAKNYVEFRGFVRVDPHEIETKPVVEDVYEYKRSGRDLELRKTYTSRWQRLSGISDQQLCRDTGGTWDPSNPQDGARQGTTTPCACADAKTFVPGAGGCMIPVDIVQEIDCWNSGGYYTDDDTTYLGNYCVCPTGARLVTAGCTPI